MSGDDDDDTVERVVDEERVAEKRDETCLYECVISLYTSQYRVRKLREMVDNSDVRKNYPKKKNRNR